MPRRFLGPRSYALFALGVVAFTLYGSYVPFQYGPRPWPEAVDAFRWAMAERFVAESRSDLASNCMLGVPLGFCCLAALRVDRPSRPATALIGVALLPFCVAFAAAVEFGQLYFPGRTCAGSDVWAQGTGAAVGVLGWVLFGQWTTDKARGALDQPGSPGNPAVLLLGYAFFVLLVELLPLDLTISPAQLYHKAKEPAWVTLVPLGELDYRPGRTERDDWKKLKNWLELIALGWPLGALVARLPGRWGMIDGLPRVFGAALALSALLELGQLTVTRFPSTTDVAMLTAGISIGWAAALALADRGVREHRRAVAVGLGAVWVIALVFIHWHPFDFRTSLLGGRLENLEWIPLGVLGVWACKPSATRPGVLVPVLISGGIAAILEFGQAMLPGSEHVASPTDVLFGFIGGGAGAEATRRTTGAKDRGMYPQPQTWRAGTTKPAAVSLPGVRKGTDG